MRIDQLTHGDQVTLGFTHGAEPAIFIGITGTGDEARATFESQEPTADGGRKSFRWEAYRYNGHWVYGTSAERLRLITEPLLYESDWSEPNGPKDDTTTESDRAAIVSTVFGAVRLGMHVLTPAERRDLIAILKGQADQ